ncbi:hypothetical protein NQ314_017830 [Rhamnusium bicolor]|uniref:Maf-like protein n=1 Tax=Rhamnusium bicolor TaxID=1586634 RepID=A0AAV8WSE5_9CUCU|nr:hypothetical protein NQ314_017830 [Rhamnusium bicolor]
MLKPLVCQLNQMRVVLASSSKQRDSLLRSTNLKFEVIPSNYEENLDPREYSFSDFVEKTATLKLIDVYKKLQNHVRGPPDMIIAFDTMVIYNGRMYGKPKTKEEAIQFITEDKAGGYGIQGIAGSFVTRIDGDVNNVIGVPLCRLAQELKKIISCK